MHIHTTANTTSHIRAPVDYRIEDQASGVPCRLVAHLEAPLRMFSVGIPERLDWKSGAHEPGTPMPRRYTAAVVSPLYLLQPGDIHVVT